jgi:hypothetical protein
VRERDSSASKKDTQKRQWIAPSGTDDEKSDRSPKPATTTTGYGSRHQAVEERKQTTATFGGRDSSEKNDSPPKSHSALRDDSSGMNRQSSTDNKPKLFKGGGTNPFAKRQANAAQFGGASGTSSTAPKNDGLFYPGSNAAATKPPTTSQPSGNQFSSITSFGARNNSSGVPGKVSDRERKSSSNIEEAYSEDGFDEESLGNS